MLPSRRIRSCQALDAFPLLQEMASRGVSLVYRLGDAAVRDKLVGALVGVLQGGGTAGGGAGRPVKLTGDTQVRTVHKQSPCKCRRSPGSGSRLDGCACLLPTRSLRTVLQVQKCQFAVYLACLRVFSVTHPAVPIREFGVWRPRTLPASACWS